MGRKNYNKGSDKTDRKIISFDQDSFAAGLIKDFPATEISGNALAKADNVVNYPNEVQGRLGSQLYTTYELPPITGRTGLVGSKAGYIITCTTNLFTEDDVGNYWVWPGTETVHEEIIRYINGFHVEVATSDTRALTTGCYMRGKVNLWHFHSVLKKWLFLIGTDFWVVDIPMTTWTKILVISKGSVPNNALSAVDEYDKDSWIVFNSKGHYHVTYYWEKFFAWKRNIPIPNIAVDEVPATATTNFLYGYIYSTARLTEMGNFIDRLTPSRIELETGTNSWGDNLQDYNDVNTVNAIDATNGQVVGPLYVPQVTDTDPVEYHTHLTHFPIYRTLDKTNLYQQDQNQALLNNPQRFIWVKDLRICAAFFARKYNGHVLARYGQFEIADIGSTIEWENGDRDTIIGYVREDEVIIAHSMYYDVDTDYMACAIGNGTVIRGSQTGYTVTRTHGGVFTASDVGTTITWSTGYRSVIEAYVDANTVTVHDNQDKVAEGLTLNPEYRNFYDTSDDTTLRSRIRDMMCKSRFLEPMPDVNDGIVVPGFLITARRNEKDLYYCAWEDNYEYLASFYNKGYQYSTKIKDNIQKLLKHPNRFSALCQNDKTWWGPINASDTMTLEDVNVIIPILGGIDILDSSIGCFDFGSIQAFEKGYYIMLTHEPSGIGLRMFNGFSFGENLLEVPNTGHTTIAKDLENIQKATASIYDGIMGYIIWGREKP